MRQINLRTDLVPADGFQFSRSLRAGDADEQLAFKRGYVFQQRKRGRIVRRDVAGRQVCYGGDAFLERRMGVVRIGFAGFQLFIHVFVDGFGDATGLKELFKSLHKRRTESGL